MTVDIDTGRVVRAVGRGAFWHITSIFFKLMVSRKALELCVCEASNDSLEGFLYMGQESTVVSKKQISSQFF